VLDGVTCKGRGEPYPYRCFAIGHHRYTAIKRYRNDF